MKKNILLIIIIFTFLTNLIYAYNSKDAEGFWLMPAKPKGRMEVVKIIVINNNLYAYAVKLHDMENGKQEKYIIQIKEAHFMLI